MFSSDLTNKQTNKRRRPKTRGKIWRNTADDVIFWARSTRTGQQLAKLTVALINSVVEFDNTATNLARRGSWWSAVHITACNCCMPLMLRQSRVPWLERLSILSRRLLFTTAGLDYCNSALAGVTKFTFRNFSLCRMVRALMVSGVRRCEHITTVLKIYTGYLLPRRL